MKMGASSPSTVLLLAMVIFPQIQAGDIAREERIENNKC
jgi:hypothetical protein